MKELGLDPPRRLALPRFSNIASNSNNGNSRRSKREITEDEIRKILTAGAEEEARRNQSSPRFLRILADKVEYARVDIFDPPRTIQREIPEGAKLIEIWSADPANHLLLAARWIEYTKSGAVVPDRAVLELGNGRELLVKIDPAVKIGTEDDYIQLSIKCQASSSLAALKRLVTFTDRQLHWIPKYAFLAALLLAMGWLGNTLAHRQKISNEREAIEKLNRELAHERELRASLERRLQGQSAMGPVSYQLVSDRFRNRGSGALGESLVTIPAGVPLVELKLSLLEEKRLPCRVVLRPHFDKRQILTEDFDKPAHAGELAVSFALPAALVDDGGAYALDLYVLNGQREPEKVDTFTFAISKK